MLPVQETEVIPEGRPSLLFPVFDGIFVSLVGQTLRLLQREPELG
jgi:hypothetical protein